MQFNRLVYTDQIERLSTYIASLPFMATERAASLQLLRNLSLQLIAFECALHNNPPSPFHHNTIWAPHLVFCFSYFPSFYNRQPFPTERSTAVLPYRSLYMHLPRPMVMLLMLCCIARTTQLYLL